MIYPGESEMYPSRLPRLLSARLPLLPLFVLAALALTGCAADAAPGAKLPLAPPHSSADDPAFADWLTAFRDDALKAGIRPKPGDYTVPMQTANGIVRAAKARIPEVRLQGIVVRDVEATIMPPGALNITLLGMSFLKRLKSFEMNGNTLVLKQ